MFFLLKLSLVVMSRGLLFIAVLGLLIAVTSLIVGHKGSVVAAPRLQSMGSVVVVHGFSCSTACGIFPDLGLKLVSPALQGRLLTHGLPGKPIPQYTFYSKDYKSNMDSL